MRNRAPFLAAQCGTGTSYGATLSLPAITFRLASRSRCAVGIRTNSAAFHAAVHTAVHHVFPKQRIIQAVVTPKREELQQIGTFAATTAARIRRSV
jgi:hypothetical protein